MTFKKLLIGTIIIIFIFISFGFLYIPKLVTTYINPNVTKINPMCNKEPIECKTDTDCNKCIDSFEIKCQRMDRNSHQEKIYGKSSKYCLPQKPSNRVMKN